MSYRNSHAKAAKAAMTMGRAVLFIEVTGVVFGVDVQHVTVTRRQAVATIDALHALLTGSSLGPSPPRHGAPAGWA